MLELVLSSFHVDCKLWVVSWSTSAKLHKNMQLVWIAALFWNLCFYAMWISFQHRITIGTVNCHICVFYAYLNCLPIFRAGRISYISKIPFKIIFERKKTVRHNIFFTKVRYTGRGREREREKTDKMPFDNSHSHEEWNCERGNYPENESERLSEREKSHQYRFSLVRDRQYNCFFKLFIRVSLSLYHFVFVFFVYFMCQTDAAPS